MAFRMRVTSLIWIQGYYGSAVRATRNGWPEVGLSETKSNRRIGTAGRGFSQVVLNSRIVRLDLLTEGLWPVQAMTKFMFVSLGCDHQSAKSFPTTMGISIC